jgi:ferredoxin hydrogenase large subunit
MSYFQVNEQCNGCLACVQNCPASALDVRDEQERRTLLHNMSKCARCATCWRVCPQNAIEFQHLLESPWDEVVSLPLVRCRVCGEPVHTIRLAEGLDEQLSDLAAPLCDRHRSRESARTRAAGQLTDPPHRAGGPR